MTLYALDGTSNRLSGGPLKWTHIALMAVGRSRSWPTVQTNAEVMESDLLHVEGDHVMYQRGVGSGWGTDEDNAAARGLGARALGVVMGLGDRLLGGSSGLGTKRRVRRAYQQICRNYADNDPTAEQLTIDVIGFSRGAATALHLTNVIYMMGIRNPRPRWRPNTILPYRTSVGWILFRDWRRLDADERRDVEQQCAAVGLSDNQLLVHDDIVVPQIRFLGLFDAVSSFALPVDTRVVDLQRFGFGFRLYAPPNIAHCSHAMALDERRKSFRNVRVHESTMERVRAERNEEVGSSAMGITLGVLVVLIGLSALSTNIDSVGAWPVWALIAVFGVAATHAVRGAVGALGELVDAGERTDVGHAVKRQTLARLGDVTGLEPDELAGLTGVTSAAPANAARTDVASQAIIKAVAPGVGLLLAIVSLAIARMIGVIDIDGVGGWDFLTAILWAGVTAVALPIIGPSLAPDSRSLRTSSEVLGLTARRIATFAALTAWVLVTWWLLAVATEWWRHDVAEPWLWRTLLVAIALTFAGGLISRTRPSAADPDAVSEGAMAEGIMTALLVGVTVFGAWVVRRLVARGVELESVPWWQYLLITVCAAVATGVLSPWSGRSGVASPPTHKLIFDRFAAREAREMWFRGNHTDIGGGGAPGLCDHSLTWMIAEADRAGLFIDTSTIQSALARRGIGSEPDEIGLRPDEIGPTMDPYIARARRLILDHDLGHISIEEPRDLVPENLRSIAKFNLTRWVKGCDLGYEPPPVRRGISHAITRRLMSPHPPRFVGVLGWVKSPDGDDSEWVLKSSAQLIHREQQKRHIERWR